GTHYELGYHIGQKIKHTPMLENRRKQWAPRQERHFIINLNTYQDIMRSFSPNILAELEGVSDALSMPLLEVIQFFGGYYLEYTRSGCSVYADRHYLVRNYDSHPRPYEGLYMFYQPTDGGYATVG